MSAGSSFPQQPKPYRWGVPLKALQLWKDVSNGIDKSQTVVWKNAVDSLDEAKKYLQSYKDARDFIENYMSTIIQILVTQQPNRIGPHERHCVEESLALAIAIVSLDLEIQLERNGECKVLDVLAHVFNKKKTYYKGNKGNWNVIQSRGLPEVRFRMIHRFHEKEMGFARLSRYMLERTNTTIFPDLGVLHHILAALGDSLHLELATDQSESMKGKEDAAIDVSEATMQFLNNCTDDKLKKLNSEHLGAILHGLQKIFDRLVNSRRSRTYEFYSFWRAITMRLITSQSLPLKLFGWKQIGKLLGTSAVHRPPPRQFEVSGAGCTFVNGKYNFNGCTTPDGYYAQQGGCISYERKIPVTDEDGGGKKLTLFDEMRSQQQWWFLSEADEEQPGTNRDIDYYQHKSRGFEEEVAPPPSGWVTCRNVGVDPPPQLKAYGLMVPPGEEFSTLEHQLAQWAIENQIIDLVLRDSVHREIISHSTCLIKFLACMCERDNGIESSGSKPSNMFCLQMSHLTLAWNTCSGDTAVSAHICLLLVSILPSCPSSLASSLLQEVQRSLYLLSENHRDYRCFRDVNIFCLALTGADLPVQDSVPALKLSNATQGEVLTLLWQLLTHPRSSSLKDRDCLEKLWSFLASTAAIAEKQIPARNGHGESLIRGPASKRRKIPLSVLESLADDVLLMIFQYLGSGHYCFVAGVSKRCRQMYRKATNNVGAQREVAKTTTSIARVAESVSRSQLYLFQETTAMDHATGKSYVDLTRCMRSKVGERAASVARAASSSGNLSVLSYALKQPEGLSFISKDFAICKNAVKNGDVPTLEVALSLGCPCNEETCGLAAEYGQFEALQKLRESRCPWNESVCSLAAGNGDLAMLQYARENDCPWNRLTLVNARQNGHLEIVQWASENGCPDDNPDDEEEAEA